MLGLMRVPYEVLPDIVASAGRIAETLGFPGLPDGVPITGMAGDQQSALFGQACFDVGDVKCTYGTGAFVLVNIGDKPLASQFGLLTTVAWKVGDEVTYALEGSAFIAGAAVQWLRDGLGLIENAADIEPLAASVASSEGVYFVPALAGLGAPYWDADARGTVTGLTRGTTAAHLARATLDGIAHQVTDLLEAMAEDLAQASTQQSTQTLARMRVDGGAAANDLLMERQARLADITVERPYDLETTARGAAMLAAVGAGIFENKAAAAHMSPIERTFAAPESDDAARVEDRLGWKTAVARTVSSVAN
jgi:glycerol kinase